MPKTVILSTARTPFGKMGGALASMDATDLGGVAMAAALDRSGVDPEQVESISYGQVLQAGQGQIPSRQAQIKAGVPKEVPSETVNKVCASGMRSVGLLDQAIRAGDVGVGVGGGMESMSNAPYLLPGARFGFRMGDVKAIDAMTHDGLTNPFTSEQMINEASVVGNELEITRPDLDRFAVRSHQLAAKATDDGKLADEIVEVTVKSRKGESVVGADEAIRPDTSIETLAKLKAIGADDATHTAGNSPGVNDGASAVVVASEDWAQANGKEAVATIVGYGMIGDDFPYLAKTPAKAAQQALEKAGLTAADVDLWEINEAFASVALNSIRMLGVEEDKVNVNGGAIALGHPIGASGGRIIGALVHELQRRGGGLGCAAICSGGGQGDAILLRV
ncbi:MAG: acetyl-CoA C-acetyltransferase [Solirubrobacterales bacterium]|nr:acetyl-CoA C-acetyltransferase [Solirubrobacterales bacterium]MCB8969446.1 acetyl-CoA C-acetyltransferase [Thermoleophilales bacterium]